MMKIKIVLMTSLNLKTLLIKRKLQIKILGKTIRIIKRIEILSMSNKKFDIVYIFMFK